MLKYESLKWLAENASTSPDEARDFILLIAQDYPELFEKTAERVTTGDFDVLPVSIAIQRSDVPYSGKPETAVGTDRKQYNQGGVTAHLTDAEYDELHSIPASQRQRAISRLRLFLPHMSVEEAYDWTSGLPNMKAYGC